MDGVPRTREYCWQTTPKYSIYRLSTEKAFIANEDGLQVVSGENLWWSQICGERKGVRRWKETKAQYYTIGWIRSSWKKRLARDREASLSRIDTENPTAASEVVGEPFMTQVWVINLMPQRPTIQDRLNQIPSHRPQVDGFGTTLRIRRTLFCEFPFLTWPGSLR